MSLHHAPDKLIAWLACHGARHGLPATDWIRSIAAKSVRLEI